MRTLHIRIRDDTRFLLELWDLIQVIEHDGQLSLQINISKTLENNCICKKNSLAHGKKLFTYEKMNEISNIFHAIRSCARVIQTKF